MMKIFKEILLCVLVGIITLFLFALVGHFYKAKDNVILLNVIIWSLIVMVSYLCLIFIPVFNKKKCYYLDGTAFAFGFLAIILYCLSQAKEINDYNYLEVISYFAGLLTIIDFVIRGNTRIREVELKNNASSDIVAKIKNYPIDVQESLIMIYKNYSNGTSFKIGDASAFINKSKSKTASILKNGEYAGIFLSEENAKVKVYKVKKQ